MKKYMTFGATVLLAAVALTYLTSFISSASVQSPPASEETILVEIYEVPSFTRNGIHIYYADGKNENIDFPTMKAENKAENGAIIVKTMNKLQADGFTTTGVASGLAGAGMITKIFMTRSKK